MIIGGGNTTNLLKVINQLSRYNSLSIFVVRAAATGIRISSRFS